MPLLANNKLEDFFKKNSRFNEIILVSAVTSLFLALGLWNIRWDLPNSFKLDEEIFVRSATRIADTGDLNPYWFGNPGSTTIYPLAGLYKLWDISDYIAHGFRASSSIYNKFINNLSDFFLIGRFLSLFYAVLTIPLVYLIGARVYGKKVGLTAALLISVYPLLIKYAQILRTDTAGLFFCYLSIWFILRLRESATKTDYALAGAAIGLAIASRYFMAALLILFIVRQLLTNKTSRRELWIQTIITFSAALLLFAVISPYFFITLSTSLKDLTYEARSTHLGADGLSTIGNFLWYTFYVIPRSITPLQAVLAIGGLVLTIRQRQIPQLLILFFLIIYLAVISLSGLHWQRWLIPVLPELALLAAYGLVTMITYLANRWQFAESWQWGFLLLTVFIITAPLMRDLFIIQQIKKQASNAAMIQEWLRDNQSMGIMAYEYIPGTLIGVDNGLHQYIPLATKGTIDWYRKKGYRYLMINDDLRQTVEAISNHYYQTFYKDLDHQGRLVKIFGSKVVCPQSIDDPSCEMPIIKVYEIVPHK